MQTGAETVYFSILWQKLHLTLICGLNLLNEASHMLVGQHLLLAFYPAIKFSMKQQMGVVIAYSGS